MLDNPITKNEWKSILNRKINVYWWNNNNMRNMGPEPEPFTHQRKVQNIGNTIS
jgi:hypothetical protein